MPIQIKKLSGSDISEFTQLIYLFEDVFEMQNFLIPPADHLRQLLADEKFMVFVATDKGKVVAGLTAYILVQYYSIRPLVYIFDLAVRKDRQRQGIGQLLIQSINSYCKEKGYEEVFVQADRVDDYAVDFYRKTKPTMEEDVLHFYYSMDKGS